MKRILLYLLLLNICITAYGQSSIDINYQKPSPVLPQVSDIMKYVDYPTDLSNGLINIDIPLYTLVDGDITLPISISYHASGLKVKEKTGKIGLGWTLNAEPSVSRNIKGRADDYSQGYLNTKITPKNTNPPYWFDEQVTSGAWDLEPDVFYYKLADKSGKFYFNRDVYSSNPINQIVVHPYEPLRISSNSTTVISSFEITDENGLHYNFSGAYGTMDDIKTQWFASSITSPNNRGVVNFSYTAPTTIWETYDSKLNPYYIGVEEMINSDNSDGSVYSVSCLGLTWPFITEFGWQNGITVQNIISKDDMNPYTDSNGVRVYEGERGENLRDLIECAFSYPTSSPPLARNQYIETIDSRTVTLTFFYDLNSEDKELIQRIEVRDKLKNEIIRKIYFYQSRYTWDFSRMKLDEIRITDKNDILIEKYKLEYNDGQMPYRSSSGADHWGFVNRISSNPPTEVPLQTIRVKNAIVRNTLGLPEEYVLSIGDASKEPNSLYVQCGILKSITYPTGRKSTFFYENHQYLHDNVLEAFLEEREKDPHLPNIQAKAAGGLRIAKVEEYDPVDQKKYIKSYTYGQNENGTGYIAHQPSMKDYTYEYFMANGTGIMPEYTGYKVTKVRMFFPNSLAEMTFNGGSSVVYDQVTEYLSVQSASGKNSLNGKTVYNYSYSYPFIEHVEGTTLNKNSDHEWMQGQLYEKTAYKIDQYGAYIPVQRNSYGYNTFNIQEIPYYKAFANVQGRRAADPQALNTVRDQYEGYKYVEGSIYSGAVRMVSETTESYNDNGVVTDRREYTYGNTSHLLPTKIETKEGDTSIKTEELSYPQDLTQLSDGEQKLLANNQLNVPLIKKTSFGNRIWLNRTKYGLTSNIPTPTSIWAGINGSEEERVKIVRSDNYGNPVEVEVDGATSFYLWAYGGTCLMAEISNATYSQIATALGADPIALSAYNSPNSYISGLRTGLANSLVTTYTYEPLVGITESVNPAGLKTYYVYDTAGHMKETYIMENGVKKILQSAIYNLVNP